MSTGATTLAGQLSGMIFGGSRHTLMIVASVDESNRLRQLAPGKAHPLWLFGHLAYALDGITGPFALQRKPTLDKNYRDCFAPDFAGGKPITTNPADYPTWDEVTSTYDATAKTLAGEVKNLADSDLEKSLKGIVPDQYLELFPTVGMTLQRMIDHDSYHRGQIALINKMPK